VKGAIMECDRCLHLCNCNAPMGFAKAWRHPDGWMIMMTIIAQRRAFAPFLSWPIFAAEPGRWTAPELLEGKKRTNCTGHVIVFALWGLFTLYSLLLTPYSLPIPCAPNRAQSDSFDNNLRPARPLLSAPSVEWGSRTRGGLCPLFSAR